MGPVLTYELLNKLRLPSFGLLLQMNTYTKISLYASENKSTEIVACKPVLYCDKYVSDNRSKVVV